MFDYLAQLNCSFNKDGTSFHKDGQREIDFVFSDLPITDLRLNTNQENMRQLSDHDPIAVQVQVPKVTMETLYPDKTLARSILERTLD